MKNATRRHSKPSTPGALATGRGAANRVRIVAGRHRGRWLDFPDAAGLRPTPNRVRETLFNWLGQSLHGRRCLDLFAGSGALGIEAASRGADEVVLVEADTKAAAALTANVARLGDGACRIVRGDALAFLRAPGPAFDVVFVDPPFASTLARETLAALPPRLAAGARVYCESGTPPDALVVGLPEAWDIVRQGRAGVVHFGLLSLREPTP